MITILQLKEKFPQYQSVSDVELAERLYDKYYSDKIDKNNFFQKVFPNIAERKIEETESKLIEMYSYCRIYKINSRDRWNYFAR